MNPERVEELIKNIEEMKHDVDEKTATKLELDKYIRIIKRLDSFSTNCEECQKYLVELENHFENISSQVHQFTKEDYKNHNTKTNQVTSHLLKTHHLTSEHYYMTTFMSVGISLGIPLGLLLFDNVALGMPIGMSIGIAIGTGLDADAKKKGKII